MTKLTIENLMKSGVHYGSLMNKWNPNMAPYIYGVRNSLHIIDLDQTITSLHRLSMVFKDTVAEGGSILFVGTNDVSSSCTKYFAKRNRQPYLHKKWFGGLLTNWKHFNPYLSNLEVLESEVLDGSIRNQRDLKKYKRLAISLEGIRNMKHLPSLLFILNPKDHQIAIKEANQMNIPVACIVDTDCCPLGIDYVIPANDDNVSSIKIINEILSNSFRQ